MSDIFEGLKDKFKQFGHSDEEAALGEHVTKDAEKKVDDSDSDDDDDKFVVAHRKIYDKDETKQDEKTLGKAAAFEALKKYAKGKKTGKDKQELEKHFVAMAVSEGLDVWKKKNVEKGETGGSKEKVMEHAAKSAIKILKKSEKEEKSKKDKKDKKGKKDSKSDDENEGEEKSNKLTDWAKKYF